jgi:hypothetical protein
VGITAQELHWTFRILKGGTKKFVPTFFCTRQKSAIQLIFILSQRPFFLFAKAQSNKK